MSDKNHRLVLAILDFLNTSIEDGTVKEDDKEGLEVAVQCIGEAFGVDPTDESQREQLSIKPATLPTIFDIYLKTSAKMKGSSPTSPPTGASASTPTPEAATASSSKPPPGPSDADKRAADTHKAEGNSHMSARRYNEAIESYTKAVDLDPANPVYYSNRAAAYSSIDDHDSAIDDAKKAAEIDPTFVKAYSRLGHAHYSKEDYEAAVEAFEQGLKIDPNNANLKANLDNAKQHLPTVDRSAPGAAGAGLGAGFGAGGGMPDLSSLAGMFGGGGGGGAPGAGGMPDLASMMNNPQIMSMAQQFMQSGGMERMMQNPMFANMARNAQSGQMPNFNEMMNNPDMQNLARNFMGGGGAPPQ